MKSNQKSANFAAITSVIILFAFVGMLSMSFVTISTTGDKKPWVVPDKDKAVKNPVASDATSIAAGKTLYTKLCKSCHGATGKGDGPKSKELETPTGSFLDATFTAQTDGEVFFKVRKGRDDMPSFSKETEANDVWNIINYVRSLKK
jgi:mono/diheme cytochrome c family protein